MKCMACKGTMNRSSAPFHIDRKGYHLQLDSVPAWVCTQCGEVYFDVKEVDDIQEVIHSLDKQAPFVAKSA